MEKAVVKPVTLEQIEEQAQKLRAIEERSVKVLQVRAGQIRKTLSVLGYNLVGVKDKNIIFKRLDRVIEVPYCGIEEMTPEKFKEYLIKVMAIGAKDIRESGDNLPGFEGYLHYNKPNNWLKMHGMPKRRRTK